MVDVTVITPTIGRWRQLERAIRSVTRQHDVATEQIVLGDCIERDEWRAAARPLAQRYPDLRLINLGEDPSSYGPARTARLRNRGIELARGRFIAHLDDDNEYEPEHLSSLVATLAARPGARVAFSWRKLLNRDGSPWIVADRNPWFRRADDARRSYAELLAAGVFRAGSNEVRDRPIGPAGEPYYLVDSSELLVERSFHRCLPFRTVYSGAEREIGFAEDRAFCTDVYAAGAELVPSRLATLRYFMGGYSNAHIAPSECCA